MIYIELIVLLDLFMNYLILASISIILNRNTNFKKLYLSSVIGCLPLVGLYLDISNINLAIINYFFSFLMSIIAFNYKNIIYTLRNTIYMYFIGIFLGGTIYLITVNFMPHYNASLSSVFILFLFSPIITYFYLKNLQEIKNINSNYYHLDIYLKDQPPITITAYLDTGNKLIDPYKRYPIILVIKKSFPYQTPHRTILVPYNTIDNHGLLPCFKPTKIYIHNIGYRKRVLIGLIDNIGIDNAEAILNQKLLERI